MFVESPSAEPSRRGCPTAVTAIATRRARWRRRPWAPTTDGCSLAAARTTSRTPQTDADALPLSDMRVADFTAFWAGPGGHPGAGALGADVIKVEGVRRPDGMRFAGGTPATWDQWWEWGPVFLCSNTNKRGISIELEHAARTAGSRLDLIAQAISSSRTSRRG